MLVVDTETTGVSPKVNSLLSIGAIDMHDPDRRFYGECRAYKGAHISPEALAINGFTEEQALDPKKISDKELVQKFIEWAKASEEMTLAGENPSFDQGFIAEACERYSLDYPFARRSVDLHAVSYAHHKRQGREVPMKNKHSDLNLGKTLSYVGLPSHAVPHNALTDALLEAECFSRLIAGKKLLGEFEEFDMPVSLR